MQVWDTQAWVDLAWEIRDFQHAKGGRIFSSALTRKWGSDISNPARNQCHLLHFYFVSFFFLNTILNSSKGFQVFALGSPPFGSCKSCKYFHKKSGKQSKVAHFGHPNGRPKEVL